MEEGVMDAERECTDEPGCRCEDCRLYWLAQVIILIIFGVVLAIVLVQTGWFSGKLPV